MLLTDFFYFYLPVTEYAMNEGLWGHAFFLASKLDERTHTSVMTRFANSVPPHDSLQTLYQLFSCRIPAIVTVKMLLFYDKIIHNMLRRGNL